MDKWFPHGIAARRTRLLEYLRTGRMLTAVDLAQWEDVSSRTIHRDITALRRTGHVILGAAGAGYVMRPQKVLWPAGTNEEGD